MHVTRIILIVIVIAILIAGIFYWREHRYDKAAVIAPPEESMAVAYFAGGCFWCTESDFEKLPGVSEAISGYSGGTTNNPTYQSVSTHTTGHLGTVEVRYDPAAVSYQTLIEYFFSHIDPTDPNGQFVDQGESYRSAVFYRSGEEKRLAEDELRELTESGAYGKPLVTKLIPFQKFYPAEDYHQDYWKKNPVRYSYYRTGSGRDQYLEKICQVRATKNVPCRITK